MLSMPDLLIERLILSFTEDTVRCSLQALTAALRKCVGGGDARVEFLRREKDARPGGLSPGVYRVDELVGRILDPEARWTCFDFECKVRWNRNVDRWDFSVLRTAVPHIVGGPASKPTNSATIGQQAMREWVAEGAVDVARPLYSPDASHEGWVVGRPACIYVLEKINTIPKVSKRYEKGRSKKQASLIEPLMTELNSILNLNSWWDDCLEITGGTDGVNAFVREFDKRLLQHWGETTFGARLTDLGVSLRRWLTPAK